MSERMGSDWVRTATDVEIAQMKLVYAAVYTAVGIMSPETCATVKTRQAQDDVRSIKSVESESERTEWIPPPNYHDQQVVNCPLSKRFVPAERLVPYIQKHFKGLKTKDLQHKFRWLCRDNSDKMILRYIRQLGDSKRVCSAIGETITTHLTSYDPEELLKQGEAHYLGNSGMMKQHESGKRTIVGCDKQGRPLNILTARRNFTKAQSPEDLEKYSLYLLEQTYTVCQDSLDGAIIIFDMQGFKRANMDFRVTKFIVEKMSKLYPMFMRQLFVYKAPKVFHALYKLIHPMFDPNLVKRIKFVNDTEEMLTCINSSELPVCLGGTSAHKYTWIPPNQEDDAPLRDTRKRDELKRERLDILKALEDTTQEWIVASGPQNLSILENQRRDLLTQLRDNYWRLDPYVRSRSVFDRNGIFGKLRPELAEGGVAQPVVHPQATDRKLGSTHTASFTLTDHSSYTESIKSEACTTESYRVSPQIGSLSPLSPKQHEHIPGPLSPISHKSRTLSPDNAQGRHVSDSTRPLSPLHPSHAQQHRVGSNPHSQHYNAVSA